VLLEPKGVAWLGDELGATLGNELGEALGAGEAVGTGEELGDPEKNDDGLVVGETVDSKVGTAVINVTPWGHPRH
jgi:hypothetical protein